MEHPAIGRLRVEVNGAWIVQLVATDDAAGEASLLQAAYDDCGRLVSLIIGADKTVELLWSETGQLMSWRRGDGRQVHFGYRDGLLSEVQESDNPVRRFTWRSNPGFGRGDSRWAAPVHLASDGESTYTYELTSKGFRLVRKETVTGEATATLFNPRRLRLEQRTAEGEFLVVFRRIEGRSVLAYIECDGEMIERYRYDDHGQLSSIARRGEPERVLSYDETGRIMSLVELSEP